jgi:hypothetical protein
MTVRRRGDSTLGEQYAQLQAEGKWEEFVARKREIEDTKRRKLEEMAAVEAPITAALRGIGIEVEWVWQLAGRETDRDADLVPILLEHFRKPYPPSTRESIAMALARPVMLHYWGELLNLYRAECEPSVKNGLAGSISTLANKNVIADVVALAKDPTLGESRILLLRALSRSRDASSREALKALEDDPDLRKEIAHILGRKGRLKS